MKHIKKYRGLLTKEEQENLRSNARQKAKQILSQKHIEEYNKLKIYFFNKLRRELIKEKEKPLFIKESYGLPFELTKINKFRNKQTK